MELALAGDIINDAAVELGLKPDDVADPFASPDPNFLMLCRLLKRVGRSLVRVRDWTHLRKAQQFNIDEQSERYALPADFDRIIPDTVWSATDAAPLGPVLTSQDAFSMLGRGLEEYSPIQYRIVGNWFSTAATPPLGTNTILFEYISTRWVMPTGQTSPTTSVPTVITDTLWFDENLLVRGLKLAYLRAKGMDTSHAQDEFNQALNAAAGGDGVAGPISILGGHSTRPQLGRYPESGWGL